MALSTQPYKGARDFYPADKRVHNYMFGVVRRVVESFGYEEYDAPLLEPMELYLAKTGQEIVNEQTYEFTDRGGRRVAIRPEMTPSVSRLVAARRQALAYPLRLYNLGIRWRYERPQRGRWREFWQMDADIFGAEGIEAEQELILLADTIMRQLGAQRDMYTIRLNSRALTDAILRQYIGLDGGQAQAMTRLIDKMDKLGASAFIAEATAVLTPPQRSAGRLDKLTDVLKTEDIADLPPSVMTNPAVGELRRLMDSLNKSLVTNIKFDPTLARGFDYYTGIVFEVFDNHPGNNRSMFGGGRYDGLISAFGAASLPTAGFALGDATLKNFLEAHQLLPALPATTDLYIVLIGDVSEQAQPAINKLRAMGLNVAVDISRRQPDKQIKTAVRQGVSHALFIGGQEIATGQFRLKNLANGQEVKSELEQIADMVKNRRAS